MDWIKDAIKSPLKVDFTKGCILYHPGGKGMYKTNIPSGLYIFDSIEKDDGKDTDGSWVSCYITKKVGSGFHYYVKCTDMKYVASKDEAKKFSITVNSTLL